MAPVGVVPLFNYELNIIGVIPWYDDGVMGMMMDFVGSGAAGRPLRVEGRHAPYLFHCCRVRGCARRAVGGQTVTVPVPHRTPHRYHHPPQPRYLTAACHGFASVKILHSTYDSPHFTRTRTFQRTHSARLWF